MIKMKSFLKITIIVFLSAGIISNTNSCKKEKAPTLPVLTTVNVSGISPTGAVSGGNVSTDGGSSVTVRGVCWTTSTNPTVEGSHTTDGTGTGSFASTITGLTANTPYYVKAYATNSAGTAYGNEVSFTTNPILLPTLTTTAPSSVTSTSAVSGGNITFDGNGTITARGVCWGTTANPSITDSHTNDGTGAGSFASNLTGLSAGTNYFERAYATNSAGTAYGNQVTFNTMIADIDGNLYNIVSIGTQVWLKENLKVTKYQDGTTIPNISDNTIWSGLSAGAYCWYNNNSATYKDSYGALYNWYTLSSAILCPAGWHAPTDAEWHQLILFLDPAALLSNPESLIAGNKLKESGTTHWQSTNSGATNESGFTALPGGSRDINGAFSRIGTSGFWWGSDNSTAWYRDLDYNYAGVIRVSPNNKNGFSVRCIKN
jgi:uncharacterized protein (TIGR02145 family)